MSSTAAIPTSKSTSMLSMLAATTSTTTTTSNAKGLPDFRKGENKFPNSSDKVSGDNEVTNRKQYKQSKLKPISIKGMLRAGGSNFLVESSSSSNNICKVLNYPIGDLPDESEDPVVSYKRSHIPEITQSNHKRRNKS